MSGLLSMTGFGRASHGQGISGDTDGAGQGDAHTGWTHAWEIRSVNSRHLDLKWRLPLSLRCMEPGWEKVVREYASRGRLDLNLHLRIIDPALLGVSLNVSQARAMLQELGRFADTLGSEWRPDLNRLLSAPHLWDDELREPDPAMVADLELGLRQALADWNRSRAVEGEALAKDLAKRLIRLTQWLDRIKDHSPSIKTQKQEALVERIRTAMEAATVEPDQDRLLQEAAILADKLDISEELTRLSAHLDRFDEIVTLGGEAGKRLDFTLQECFREINTCGNKAQDPQISRLVVDFKAELEKCREQVQNLE